MWFYLPLKYLTLKYTSFVIIIEKTNLQLQDYKSLKLGMFFKLTFFFNQGYYFPWHDQFSCTYIWCIHHLKNDSFTNDKTLMFSLNYNFSNDKNYEKILCLNYKIDWKISVDSYSKHKQKIIILSILFENLKIYYLEKYKNTVHIIFC